MTKSATKPGSQRIKILWREEGAVESIRIHHRRNGAIETTPPLWWIPRRERRTEPSRFALYEI
jgi:hypothetical protein